MLIKRIRKSILQISAILCLTAALPIAANAAEWRHFDSNFFGIQRLIIPAVGGYGHVVRATTTSNNLETPWFRFAPGGLYLVGSNFIGMPNDYSVDIRFGYGLSRGEYVTNAWMIREPKPDNPPSGYDLMIANTYISTQASIVCAGITFIGPSQTLSGQYFAFSSIRATCPNGRAPESGQAQFYTGVGRVN